VGRNIRRIFHPSAERPYVDHSNLLDLFSRMMREEFGLVLEKRLEQPAVDPKVEALIDALAETVHQPKRS